MAATDPALPAAPVPRTWTRVRQMAHSVGSYDSSRPLAAFDFDSTLWPYRGRGPSENLTRSFLTGLSSYFNLLIVSNRSAGTGAALAPLRKYVDELDLVAAGRVTVYAPTAHDRDRKPHTGAWEHYLETFCAGTRPRFVFYCGDAAGRPGDHSACDYAFALNIGARFTTPETLFGEDPWADPVSYGCSVLQPAELSVDPDAQQAEILAMLDIPSPLAIIMVGSPASGKSFVVASVRARSREFALASGDIQGPRHKRSLDTFLAMKLDVIVDNTSPTAADRGHYAEKARAAGYNIVFCHVATPKEVCFHLNAARCQLGTPRGGSDGELPAVALHTYWKRHEPPTQEEANKYGARLVKIPFAVTTGAPPEVTDFRYV